MPPVTLLSVPLRTAWAARRPLSALPTEAQDLINTVVTVERSA